MIYLKAEISGDGLIKPQQFKLYRSIFQAKKLIGEPVIIGVEKYRKQRSKRQNRYVWGVIVPILQNWHRETQGEAITKDEAYAYIRTGILEEKPVIKSVAGVEVITFENKRLSQRTTKDFAEVVDRVVNVMSERGCHIPLPKEENLLTDFIDDL